MVAVAVVVAVLPGRRSTQLGAFFSKSIGVHASATTPFFMFPCAQTTELKQLVDGIKASYVATAVGIHRASRLQLEEAGRASAEALEAAARKRIGGSVCCSSF